MSESFIYEPSDQILHFSPTTDKVNYFARLFLSNKKGARTFFELSSDSDVISCKPSFGLLDPS